MTRIAVLIDADNIARDRLSLVLAEVAKSGSASVRRAYGNWAASQLSKWQPTLLELAIEPVQQFAYTAGKNATDIRLVIDAMDLLHGGQVDEFVLVSSDSDFTPLVMRLRQAGALVTGFGARTTPKAVTSAVDRFVYLEALDITEDAPAARRLAAGDLQKDDGLVKTLLAAVDAVADEDGWARLGGVGSQARVLDQAFDPRNWGYAKLSTLVGAIGIFEVRGEGAAVAIKRIPRTGR